MKLPAVFQGDGAGRLVDADDLAGRVESDGFAVAVGGHGRCFQGVVEVYPVRQVPVLVFIASIEDIHK